MITALLSNVTASVKGSKDVFFENIGTRQGCPLGPPRRRIAIVNRGPILYITPVIKRGRTKCHAIQILLHSLT
mgnify:CR=1 FL=1